MRLRNRYTVTAKRKRKFEQRDGEDVYAWVSRQISMARPYELTWLYLLRHGDEKQRQAMEFSVAHRAAWWTRFASLTALAVSVVAIVVAIVVD